MPGSFLLSQDLRLGGPSNLTPVHSCLKLLLGQLMSWKDYYCWLLTSGPSNLLTWLILPVAWANPSTWDSDTAFTPALSLCPQVVSFMKSPVGQYLDRHPFLTLTLLVFVAVSAVPVGSFLLLVVLTSLAAFVGVILLEGIVLIYSPSWKMTHSCQMFLSKSHQPRQLVGVVKTWTLESVRIPPPPVWFWTRCLLSLSLKFLICKIGM